MAKKRRKDHSRKSAESPAPEKTRFPAWLVWPVIGCWLIFVLKTYYSRYMPHLELLPVMLSPGQYVSGLLGVLPGHLFNLGTGLAFLFACFALGRAALRYAGFSFRGALEEASFSLGAGFGLLAAYVFILSSLKALYLGPVAAFLLFWFGWGVFGLKRAPLARLEGAPGDLGPLELGALAALLLAMLINLAGAMAPEIFYDSLVYHLAVPNYFVISRGFAPMEYNFYSNLPFTHGMVYAAALLVKGAPLAKLVNYSAGIFTVVAVIAFGARYFTLRAGLLAALIFYTVAYTMMAAWSAGTESMLMLFSVLALYAALRREAGDNNRWLWLAAAFCGLAMGVKYTGFFTSVAVMLVCAWQDRSRPALILKNLALFTLIATVFTGPWLVKNWIYKGNPVYPFALDLFGVDHYSDPQKLKDFIRHAAQMGPLTLKNWLLAPWKATMGQLPNSEFFTPLFLALLPVLFLAGLPVSPVLPGLWIFFLVIWGGWSVSSTMVRFLMPAYPAAGLLIAAYLFSDGHKLLKRALRLLVVAVCLGGIFWAANIFYSQGRWRPLTGAISTDDYLSHTQASYPYACYAALKFINENTGPDARVLMIGDEKSFYLKKDLIVSSVYDKTAIVEYASAAAGGEELFSRLKKEGVTHLMVNMADAIRLGRDYRMFYWDEKARKAFYDMWDRHVVQVYAFDDSQGGQVINRIGVFKLVEKLPEGKPPAFNVMKEIIMKNIERPR